jgi:hypothetical protein
LIDPEEFAMVIRRLASQTPEELRADGLDPEDVAALVAVVKDLEAVTPTLAATSILEDGQVQATWEFHSADASIRFYEILRDLAPTTEERAQLEEVLSRLLQAKAERKH